MVKLVYTKHLKCFSPCGCAGSSPVGGTKYLSGGMVDTLVLGANILGCMGSSPILGTMEKIVVEHNGIVLRVECSQSNTKIIDSYKVKNKWDMKFILYQIRDRVTKDKAIHNRSISSMVNEWSVHNLLYSLGIQKDRTKDVDLNINQPWYIKVGYFLLSPIYFIFN